MNPTGGLMKNSKLFHLSHIDPKDELDQRFQYCHSIYTSAINGLSEREIHDTLNMTVCKGAQQYEEISLGLLYSILSEPTNCHKAFRDLMLISRDGLNLILTKINQIICEKWSKLMEPVKKQMLWITQQLVKNAIVGTDSVFFYLVRQMAGGDLSPKNVWLIENVLDMLKEYEEWLLKHPFTVALVVYTYLRLIEDHFPPIFAPLRLKETLFCVKLLRSNFQDCTMIGRDLVRLLQNVSRIPEFDVLWQDILFRPTTLSPHFTGLGQLLSTKTPRRFPASRLTPEMEARVAFLTSKVRFGQHRRYQEWFSRQYLSTPESQSLRTDLIRFICSVIHPTNEILCSEVIPRWALIGWLLTTCTNPVSAANAKTALFYDWLAFDPHNDNIMNIEPAILVIHHSLKPHPALAQSLIEFMCRLALQYYQPATTAPGHSSDNSYCAVGIRHSLKTILDKRVLPSLAPIFGSDALDRDLKYLAHETLGPAFVPLLPNNTAEVSPKNPTTPNEMNNAVSYPALPPTPPSSTSGNSMDEDDVPAKFKQSSGKKKAKTDLAQNNIEEDNVHGGVLTIELEELYTEEKVGKKKSEVTSAPFNLDLLNPYFAKIRGGRTAKYGQFEEHLDNLDEDLKGILQSMRDEQEKHKALTNAYGLSQLTSSLSLEEDEILFNKESLLSGPGVGSKSFKKGNTLNNREGASKEDPFYLNGEQHNKRRKKKSNKTAENAGENLEEFLALQCSFTQSALDYVVGSTDYEPEASEESLAYCLASLLTPYFKYKFLNGSSAGGGGFENLNNASHTTPVVVLFRTLTSLHQDFESSRSVGLEESSMLSLLARMQVHEPALGYHLLAHLATNQTACHEGTGIEEYDEDLSPTALHNFTPCEAKTFELYREFCKLLPPPNDKMGVALVKDLETCAEEDQARYIAVLPAMASAFPEYVRNHQGLVRSYVALLDSETVTALCLLSEFGGASPTTMGAPEILRSIFRADQELADLIEDSLDWEPLEQIALWRLLSAYFGTLPSYASDLEPITSINSHNATDARSTTFNVNNVNNLSSYNSSSLSLSTQAKPGATTPNYALTNSSIKKCSPGDSPVANTFRDFCIATYLLKLPLSTSWEALSSVFTLLKTQPPDVELIKCLLGCELTKGKTSLTSTFPTARWPCPSLTVLLLKHWSTTRENYGESLAEIVATLLTNYADPRSRLKASSAGASRKEVATGISLEQILGHLEQLRRSIFPPSSYNTANSGANMSTNPSTRKRLQTGKFFKMASPSATTAVGSAAGTQGGLSVKTLFSHDLVRLALQEVKAVCSESLKSRFGDLFSMVEDDIENTHNAPSSSPQLKPLTNSHSPIITQNNTASRKFSGLPPSSNTAGGNLPKRSKKVADIYSDDGSSSNSDNDNNSQNRYRTDPRHTNTTITEEDSVSNLELYASRKRKKRTSSISPVLDSDSD